MAYEVKSKKLNKTFRELLKALNGQEIRSMTYENVVGVKGNEVIDAGVVVDKLDTDAKVKKLWDEYIYDEYGTSDTKEIARMEGF